MASRVSSATVWLCSFAVGFVITCILLLITLFTPPPVGDLARLGEVSETEFGWQRPPPQVPRPLLQGSPLKDADVLVIGDSFSMTHRWQSALVEAGYRVTTTFWGTYGDGMCADFEPWLKAAGYRGQLIIMASVERLLPERLKNSTECQTMRGPFTSKIEPFWESLEHVPTFRFNTGAPLMTGVTTYLNMRRIRNATGDILVENGTYARVVKDGCKYFSNRMCDRALFFADDVTAGALGTVDLARLQTFMQKHKSIPMIWAVIPNKTTVYTDPTHSATFVTALKEQGLGPDLFAFSQEMKGRVMDFYFPNDTHLSMHGQLEFGRVMLEEVRKRLPTPGKNPP